MKNNDQTVAILYGWAEGLWHSRSLICELEKSGFRVVKDAADADIIFAHSAGCYYVPKDARAKLILLVGLPYASVYKLVTQLPQKVWVEFVRHYRQKKLRQWFNGMIHGGWYAVTQPYKTYDLVTKLKPENLPDTKNSRVRMVRPKLDAFMLPDLGKKLLHRGYEYVEVDGSHDGWWLDPEPYVGLIIGQRIN